MTKKNDFRLFRTLSDSNLPLSEALEAPDEPYDLLDSETIDISRIIHSMMEELQAFNDYNIRMYATKDKKLREILEHNRDEESDHFMMLLEMLRMKMPVIDERVKKYLFKEGKVED
jgi:hypothetical protein